MGAKAESLAIPGRHVAPFVLAIVFALTVGVAVGSLITRSATSDATATTVPTATDPVVGIQPWDAQKLDAMEGRQTAAGLASAIGSEPKGSASVGAAGIRSWDQGMVDAMEDYQSFYGA